MSAKTTDTARQGYQDLWLERVDDLQRSIATLSTLYDSLLDLVARIKRGGAPNLFNIKALLDKTCPTTAEEYSLALVVTVLARHERGALIKYLFQTRQACLLLLVDGRGAEVALGVEKILAIQRDSDGFHVSLRDDFQDLS